MFQPAVVLERYIVALCNTCYLFNFAHSRSTASSVPATTMSSLDAEQRTPLLQEFRAPQPRRHAFSSAWRTIMAMAAQMFLCGLIWAFAGVMIINEAIPLPDSLAHWTRRHPSETNMLVTMISTILGISVSL